MDKHKCVPGWVPMLLAVSAGMIVANLYYAQPVAGPMGEDTGLSVGAEGLVVTLTQIGYALGLVFIVPLSDMLENRKLVATLLVCLVAALTGTVLASGETEILVASFVIGITAVGVQVLVPYSAHIATEETRGRAVGNVVSGVLIGIMLARPVSSFVTSLFSWRVVFAVSAVFMLILAVVLSWLLPKRRPSPQLSYWELIGSLPGLLKTQPVLLRNSFYQGALFYSFSIYWTVVPLHLAREFGYGQGTIALFALVGVTGAVVAPFAGRAADKGRTKGMRYFAFSFCVIAFVIANIVREGRLAAALLLVAGIVLDMGSTASLVTCQREVFSLGADIRGRVNGLFMAMFFLFGALGSATGGWLYAVGGWSLASVPAALMPLVAFAVFLTEKRTVR